MPRALITGITGQDGLYLSELLLSKGYEVFGLIRGQNNPKYELVERTVPGVKLLAGDLTDFSSLIRTLEIAQPDEVYNLGAISFVAYSWENAALTSDVTGKGVLNMLESTRLYAGSDLDKVRFYQASSSEMFGKVQDVPQRESTLLWPRSPYGVAKVFGHYMTINYRESYGMHASSGILFNHESPRRGPEFVTRKVSQAVARISLGLQESISMATSTRNVTGGSPATTSRRCGACSSRTPPTTMSSRPTRPTRSGNCLMSLSQRWASTIGSPSSRSILGSCAPHADRDRGLDEARRALGWEPKVEFRELVKMMVASDLAEQKTIAGR